MNPTSTADRTWGTASLGAECTLPEGVSTSRTDGVLHAEERSEPLQANLGPKRHEPMRAEVAAQGKTRPGPHRCNQLLEGAQLVPEPQSNRRPDRGLVGGTNDPGLVRETVGIGEEIVFTNVQPVGILICELEGGPYD